MSAGMIRDNAWNQQTQDERREDPAVLRNTNDETMVEKGVYELRITDTDCQKINRPKSLVKCRDLPSQEMYENPTHIASLTPPRLAILPQDIPKVAEFSNGISVAESPFQKKGRKQHENR